MLETLPPGARILSPFSNLKIENYILKEEKWHKLPDDLSHFLQALMLHEYEDRGNLVGEHVGVGCSS